MSNNFGNSNNALKNLQIHAREQTAELKNIVSNTENVNLNTDSLEAKIGVDTSDTPLALVPLLRVHKDIVDNKLTIIANALDKDTPNSVGDAIVDNIKGDIDSINTTLASGVAIKGDDSGTPRALACDGTGALMVRLDNSNDSVRIVGQNTAGSNKGLGVEDTHGGLLSAGRVVVADPSYSDGDRQLLRLNTGGGLIVNDSAVNTTLTSGNVIVKSKDTWQVGDAYLVNNSSYGGSTSGNISSEVSINGKTDPYIFGFSTGLGASATYNIKLQINNGQGWTNFGYAVNSDTDGHIFMNLGVIPPAVNIRIKTNNTHTSADTFKIIVGYRNYA